jgi:hypothetical protein
VEPPVLPWLFCLMLFFGMLLMIETGRQLGARLRSKEPDDKGSLGTVEGAVFALFGLMIAFTFSGAASRFNEKRMLVADEAHNVETAYLRLELLPEPSKSEIQELFRSYLDSRIETFRRLPDMEAAEQESSRSKKLQAEIWTKSIAASRVPGAHPDAGKLLLPALNQMIAVSTTRAMALQIHPPTIIFWLLFTLALLCSLLAGFRMSASTLRSWIHTTVFVTIIAVTVYVVLDIEYPRAGLFRLEAADQVLTNLRLAMK